MRLPFEHFRHDGHSIRSMLPPLAIGFRSGAAHSRPGVHLAEGVGEIVYRLEVGFGIARLGHQQADIHQGEHDSSEVLGPADAPVRQHVGGEEPELLPGEIAAGPGELGPGDVAPGIEPRLEIFDRGEHEEIRALVVLPAPCPDPGQDVLSELQLAHCDRLPRGVVGIQALRRTRPVADRGWDKGKDEVSSPTSCRTRARVASSCRASARSISSATRSISPRPIPRVVSAGVPSRMPLVTKGDWGSSGMVFLFTVIPAWSSTFSAALPVRFLGRKSTSMRWVSVPPDTMAKPRSISAAARVCAFSTTRRL